MSKCTSLATRLKHRYSSADELELRVGTSVVHPQHGAGVVVQRADNDRPYTIQAWPRELWPIYLITLLIYAFDNAALDLCLEQANRRT